MITDISCRYPSTVSGITDCHVHIFGSSREVVAPRHPHPKEEATLSDVEKIGAAYGVTRYVLVQPSFLGFDNSLITNTIASRPHMLRGVVWLDCSYSPDSLAQLARQGVSGLRFPMKYSTTVPDWQAYSSLFKTAAQNNMHIELGLGGQELMRAIHFVLARGATVVIAHFGMFDPNVGPDRDPAFDAVLEAAQTGRVWTKLSAPYRSSEVFATRAYERLLGAIGPERTVWGSDWPHVGPRLDRQKTYGTTLEWFRRITDDRTLQRQILAESPKDLYGFTPTTGSSLEYSRYRNGETYDQ